MRARHAGLALLLLAAAPAPSVQVTTEVPRQGELADLLTAYGTAATAAEGRLTLSLMREGKIAALAVTEGEAVRPGQKLLDFTASAAASSAWQRAVDALALARTQRDHAAELLAQHLATRDQVAQADKAMADAETALAALQREGAGMPSETLTAPFAGVVATLDVAPGDRVAAGVKLLSLIRADALVVRVGIEPAQVSRLRPGQTVRLTPLAGGEAVAGSVRRVDAMLNPRSRLVDADIAAPAGALLLGTAWRAEITVGQFQGWLVPRDAVLTDKDGANLFQVNEGKAVRVGVQVLGAAGATDVVSGAIDPARRLVTQGNAQLHDGMAVREVAPDTPRGP